MEAAVGNSFLGTGLLQAAELLLLLLQAAELRPSSLLLLLLLLLAISPPAAAAAVSGLTLSRAAPRLLAAPAAQAANKVPKVLKGEFPPVLSSWDNFSCAAGSLKVLKGASKNLKEISPWLEQTNSEGNDE